MGTTLQKLTSEVIEECLNQSMEVFGRPDSEAVAGYDWSEAQAFNEHVISSERLRAGMFCVVRAVFGEQVHSADAADGRIDAGELLETQKLTFSQLQMLEDLCRQFFFLGWHARGAVE